jgi:hypothetical protein
MLNDKKLKKISKELGVEFLKELEALSPEELREKVVQAESSVKQAYDELDANHEYQELKENKKAMEQGMKDVKKRQNAITLYALHLMEEMGK